MPNPFKSRILTRSKRKSKVSGFIKGFENVEQLYHQDKLDRALLELEILEKLANLEDINKISCNILKSSILLKRGDYEKSLLISEEVFEKSKHLEEEYSSDKGNLMINALIGKANALLEVGRLNECLNTLQEGERLLTLPNFAKQDILEGKKFLLNQIRCKTFRKKGELNKVIELYEKLGSEREMLKDHVNLIDSQSEVGIIHASRGDFEGALKYLTQGLEECKKVSHFEETLSFIKLLNNLGLIYIYTDNLDQASEVFDEALVVSEKLSIEHINATILLNMGLLQLIKGEFNSSLDYSLKSAGIFEKRDCVYELTTCYSNIAIAYELMGDLENSLKYHNLGLNMAKKLENKHKIGVILNNLATNNLLSGNINEAVLGYEESLDLLTEAGINLDTSITLLNLISLTSQQGSLKEAHSYLAQLQEISEKDGQNIIKQNYNLANALVLKSSDRVVKRAEAQRIFQKITDSGKFSHEYSVIATKNLCELLIQELQASGGSEEILSEIKHLIGQLLEKAEKQDLFPLLVETYMIQSKMALLELNLELARNSLRKAREISEEKGLQSLTVLVSKEYDELLEQSTKLSEFIESELSMSERLEIAELEGMVTKLIRQKADLTDIVEEEPVIFLILGMSGMSVFSKQFVSESLLADQLIGGFLTAINAFTQQAFQETGSIEGIKHQDYTLLMQPVESLLCCYAFKGQSYYAQQKLKNFSESIKMSDIVMDILSEASSIGREVSDNPLVGEMVTRIFLSSQESVLDSVQGFFSQNVTIKHGVYLDPDSTIKKYL